MGPITGAMTGGFGDLGQAAGAGLNEYTTQMDYDKLAQFVNEAMQRGVPPQQAAQQAAQAFPGIAGGGAGQGRPAGGGGLPVPQVQVPGVNQPNVVPNRIGPSSQMQTPGGGMGSLGAPAPIGAQSARGPVDDSMLQTSPGRSPPQMQLTQQNPPQPEPYPNAPGQRVQQTSAAPSQPGQAPAQGMGGLITPRNMPLAQMILQQRQQQAQLAADQNKTREMADLRTSIEGMREGGRNDRALLSAGTKASLKQADIAAAMQTAQLNNDTRVLAILTGLQETMARLRELSADRGQRGEQFRQKMGQDDQVLDVLQRRLAADNAAYSRAMDQQTSEMLGQSASAFNEYIRQRYAIDITPGKKTTVKEPGSLFPPKLPSEKTVKEPPTTKVGSSRAAELGIE